MGEQAAGRVGRPGRDLTARGSSQLTHLHRLLGKLAVRVQRRHLVVHNRARGVGGLRREGTAGWAAAAAAGCSAAARAGPLDPRRRLPFRTEARVGAHLEALQVDALHRAVALDQAVPGAGVLILGALHACQGSGTRARRQLPAHATRAQSRRAPGGRREALTVRSTPSVVGAATPTTRATLGMPSLEMM